jgi:hypothetical protein
MYSTALISTLIFNGFLETTLFPFKIYSRTFNCRKNKELSDQCVSFIGEVIGKTESMMTLDRNRSRK